MAAADDEADAGHRLMAVTLCCTQADHAAAIAAEDAEECVDGDAASRAH